MGTNSADGRDGESPVREVEVQPFMIDIYPVTNVQFRDFVRSQKYKSEAETFGWSFVFQDFVSDELKSKVTQTIESAPWWLPIERVFWRQPAGPGSGGKAADCPLRRSGSGPHVEDCKVGLTHGGTSSRSTEPTCGRSATLY
uniref:Sulfatase-modifying factor enzyme-like domain-containing protein n=1 Tax=Oryzias melastigma TaxID=30732 RepID=A0A3B3C1E0_ORYME